jgi:hypothetical protein
MALATGIKVISKFILNKGVRDAVKKFGKEAVDKVMKSKTHKEMIKNPPMTSGQKAVAGASAGTAAVGTAATGYGYKTTSDKMKEIKAEKKANGGMMNKKLTKTVPPKKGPNSQGMRGTGAAIRGTKFKGVF